MKNFANFCMSRSKLAVSSMSKQKVTGVISDKLTLFVFGIVNKMKEKENILHRSRQISF